MVRKERSIEVKIIENKIIYEKMLIDFFVKKYNEKYINNHNKSS